jgi:hypothetical protein
MPEVVVEIVRYVSDEPQPGLVECVLVDALGNQHSFVEKSPVVSCENLLAVSIYPRSCIIACLIEEEWIDESARNLVRIDTSRPWGVESIDGATVFVVLSSQLRKR